MASMGQWVCTLNLSVVCDTWDMHLPMEQWQLLHTPQVLIEDGCFYILRWARFLDKNISMQE